MSAPAGTDPVAAFVQSIAIREWGEPFTIPDDELAHAFRTESLRFPAMTAEQVALLLIHG